MLLERLGGPKMEIRKGGGISTVPNETNRRISFFVQ
jgi:hypothetical protein